MMNCGVMNEPLDPMPTPVKDPEEIIRGLRVLLVDDELYTRKVIRALLMAIGISKIFEAGDGKSGLDAIETTAPDLVLVDWEMPGLDGPGFVRTVRSPETFPRPDVPIIMLTGHSERSRVVEAVRLGIHEYLLKPVSSQSLHDRILSVVAHPRKMVRIGEFYGPEPRKQAGQRPGGGGSAQRSYTYI
jgi:two-component system, chemotaxis family, chemotaxis protein CheY